ncbi:MAG: DUF805 domain-containing protein [Alphaproteobacteria bacterium]|nr:DUF805 domain-containing protein [Alphaproteobacteria bacterium]
MLYLLSPFVGRIGRGQWWLAQLVIFALCFFASLIVIIMFHDPTAPGFEREFQSSPVAGVIILAGVCMNCCACLNRLHDTGRSGL